MTNPSLALRNPHPFRSMFFKWFRGPNRIADTFDLALATGVSEKTAERWTNGQAEPSGADLQLIAGAYPETEDDIAAVLFPGKSLVPDLAVIQAAMEDAEAQFAAFRKRLRGETRKIGGAR